MLDEAAQNIGAHFGYFERKQDIIPSLSAARIQHQLAAGQQWAFIEQTIAGYRDEYLVVEQERPTSREYSDGH
jgi:hypothetical protein